MRKLLLAFVFLVVGLSPAAAQNWPYVGYARITVDSTSGGVSFPASVLTSTGHVFPSQAFCFVETADIRWTVDGTAPTTSIGNVASAGSALPAINGSNLLVAFRAIQDGASSATLSCNFFAGGQTLSPLSAGSGGSGSGGGGGGSVTQGTDPWIVAGGGTAGNSGTNALTIQGIAGGTAVTVTPEAGSFGEDAEVDATPILTTGPLILCDGNSSPPTAVTAGRAQYVHCNLNGQIILAPAPGPLVSGAITSAMTGTTSTSLVSGTGSNYLYIQSCVVSNASTTVSTDILLQDGSGGTTLAVIPAPAATVTTTGGGGATHTFGPAGLKVPTAGNALYAANVTTGSSTKISCNGYRSTVSY